MRFPTDPETRGPLSGPRSLMQRGAALVEMAILLPVLVLCFYGVVEIGQYLTMSERMTKTVNQLSAILYTLRPSDLQSGGTANTVIGEAIRQSQTLAKPFASPTITVRYCQRRTGGGTGPMEQIYFGATTPRIQGCGDGPGCQDSLITQSGYGAYVQAYACQRFQPVLTPRFFKGKNGSAPVDRTQIGGATNGDGGEILVTQVAFIPLTDTNQTALIRKAGNLSVPTNVTPVIITPPACGGTGQPACPVACGGTGQPACNNPPTCGQPGLPACPTTCGGAGQPACTPTTCGGAGQPACPDPQAECALQGGSWDGTNCTIFHDTTEDCAAQGMTPNPSGSGCIETTCANPNEVRGSDGQCTDMPCGNSGYWIPPYAPVSGGPTNGGGCVLQCPSDMAVDDRGGFGYCVPSVCNGSGLTCQYQGNPVAPGPTGPVSTPVDPGTTPIDNGGCPDGTQPVGGGCSF